MVHKAKLCLGIALGIAYSSILYAMPSKRKKQKRRSSKKGKRVSLLTVSYCNTVIHTEYV